MTRVQEEIVPGSVFALRYRVDRLLGQGAMGTVVAAEDVTTGARVAVKCLLPIHRHDPRVVARFQREARATACLSSEHVVRVIEEGEVSGDSASSPIPYFVMEHLDGRDLRSIVREDGPLSPRRAAKCVSQACAALAEAHDRGIVHRDVKPSNLFVARRDGGRSIVKVLDFGVARIEGPGASGEGPAVTAENDRVGTLSYMPPEQIADARSVDARADIWALGASLYYLVTGEKPFYGDCWGDLVLSIIIDHPRPLAEVRPDLPHGLAAVIERCLEKDPERRYASAADLSRALAPFTRPAPEAGVIEQPPARTDELSVDAPVDSAA